MTRPFSTLLLVVISVSLGLSSATAQRTKPSDKRGAAEANSTYNAIYSDPDPYFKESVVPEKWKNNSAVILALKNNSSALRKTALIEVELTTRIRIKLQDKAAIEEFSEMYFQKDAEFGIKIIKPDGSEVMADTSKIVTVEESPPLFFRSYYSSGSDYRKIPIPNLEIGDIIDYFYKTSSSSSSQFVSELCDYRFNLSSTYPIVHQEFNFIVDKGCFISFSSFENGPELVEGPMGKDSGGRERATIKTYKLEDSDREPLEIERWTYQYREFGFIRFRLVYIGTPLHEYWVSEDGSILRSISNDDLAARANKYVKGCFAYYQLDKTIDTYMAKKFGRNAKLRPTGLPLAEELYYAFRYEFAKKPKPTKYKANNLSSGYFAKAYMDLLKENDINSELVVMTPRWLLPGPDQILMENEVYYGVLVEGMSVPIFTFHYHSHFDYINPDYAGTEAYVVTAEGREKTARKIRIPDSDPADFLFEDVMITSFNEDFSGLNLEITAKYPHSEDLGFAEFMLQNTDYIVADHIMYDPEYRDASTAKNTARTALIEQKKADEQKDQTADKEKNFLEQLKERAEDKYTVLSYDSFEVINEGRNPGESHLILKEKMVVGDAFSKAGPNYLIDLGKLMSDQVQLEEKEKKERFTDAYISKAMTYRYVFNIELPAGYKPDGLDQLIMNTESEYGSFKSTAVLNGNTVEITAEKTYKKDFIPKEDWLKAIPFLEMGYEFSQKKLVLKKA